ncbi:hypothetical protein CFC21_060066 [Triticum aestivum]|uniref:Histidine-containing phosphotransfer protein n=2 Tax=Triticum aestivum TaxID=4565 RepID=A0A3B6JBS9_WHEAT|nr:histidine-containing phosphotransfer protein 2-like [Triticum aestivum]KAF7051876.1 hypothetical protein CFC21_060066 [Triticum aestivum]
MSAAQIRAEINGLIASKFAEGTVDQYFLQLYVMRRYKKIRKGMVVEVMERFLQDADKILTEIAVLLNEPQLDYDKVEGIADQLEGCSSSSVGAKRVNLSCVEYFHPEAKTEEGNQPVVDFDKVDALVQQLKGCSSSVGANKLSVSCMHFRRFNHSKSKEGYLIALAPIMNEFCDVRNMFLTILQMEEQVDALGPKY